MNNTMKKRILAILLSVSICISNCALPTYADEAVLDSFVESGTDEENESVSADMVIENPAEEGNSSTEQGTEAKENLESQDNAAESNDEINAEGNTAENDEETISDSEVDAAVASEAEDTENAEKTLMTLSPDTGTFNTIEDLEKFRKESSGAIQDSLTIDTVNKTILANANGLILLSCVVEERFDGYTITLNGLSGGNSDLTQPIDAGEVQFRFHGLGSKAFPFCGTIVTNEEAATVELVLDTPFFNVLDVSQAELKNINTLKIRTAEESGIAFAQTVQGNGDWNTVKVDVEAYERYIGETRIYTRPGSCIGTVESVASFTLGAVNYSSEAKVNSASDNAGLLCNTLKNGAAFTVNSVSVSEAAVNVTSESGAAGGLIGCMEENGTFSVGNAEKLTIGANWTITGKKAGALIGEAKNAALNLNVEVNGAKVISNAANGSAGGLIGTYHLTPTDSGTAFQAYDGLSETIQMRNVVLDATGGDSYIGGLFGELVLSNVFTVRDAKIQSTAGYTKTGSSYNLKSSTSYGGLAGRVYTEDSTSQLPTLKMEGTIQAVSTVNADITYYGGLTGIVGTPGIDDANTNGAYVVINSTNAESVCYNVDKIGSGHYFGGAVAGLFYHSVLEIAENATFSPTASDISFGGGIVGAAARGSTLRLAGTTNLTNVTFTAPALGQNPGSVTNNRNANGQIAGIQNAAIIYAAKSWVLKRPNNPGEIDDIGNYGSVIRLGKNIGEGSNNLGDKGGLSDDLISQNTTTHKTVFGADAASLNEGVIEIASADQFALLSIAEQTYGDFGIYPSVTNGHIISGNKVTKIVLAGDIDLSNTGISGLQRDFYYASNGYSGELDGWNHELTLDIGQTYAENGIGAGNGQIHGRSQVGLFSWANATIKNLTINGSINIRERTLSNASQKSTMAVGGCIALSTGASTFENVTTNVTIQCAGNGTESFIGGLVGLQQGTNCSVSISQCTGNATIKDDTSAGANSIGGLIGTYAGGGTITVSGTTLTGIITGGAIADAKYGGLISVIKDSSAKIHLNSLTIDGQRINNSATTSSGGLLGYEWNDTEVYFGDEASLAVTVKGESAVTVNGNASVGGLVYCATGYWQVNGLSFTKANIQNQAGDLGLLICCGRKGYNADTKQGAQLLYLEETKYHAYQIDTTENVTVSSTGGYFDEWVVYTAESAETITDNGNSVISIATEEEDGKRKGFDPTDGTSTGYQNRTTNQGTAWATANLNARYYYDLDVIRANASANASANGYVDTPGELVLWSVWRYCEKIQNGSGTLANSNIQQYFTTEDIKETVIGGNSQSINLTGFSYYPVNVDAADVTIQNCTIVFANQMIESAETQTGNGLDVLNRKTSGTDQDHTQHYMMHSGLLLNYRNTSTTTSTATLSVNNVTLQGTVGKGPNETGSGAIICGTVAGSGVGGSHFANVKLNGIVLDGLTVNSDTTAEGYAPLLINTVGSYGSIDAQQISTKYFNSSEKAATSLIGHVGDENATNISLAFSNKIALNGRTAESIFSHATLLESFQYSGASSSGYYHFNEDEACIYGREINGTVENGNLQLNYFDTGNRVKDGENTNFNTGAYLPYVCQTKVTDSNRADTFHELEINVVKPDLTKGCGTYDDPYVIDQPAQLQLVAQYIARDSATAGWKINMVTDKDKIKSESDENHTTYTYGNGSWTNGSATCEQSVMRDYLRNAYYKIDADLQFNKYEGLGTTTYPFRGVVDGGSHTVTIDASKITSGFVNVSYGSVIQNLSITYTGSKTLSNTQASLNSNTVANESYFGGIIGDVKGGDNLIRKVSVEYKDVTNADYNFRITIQNHLQCVGGFLGVVEGGGVIFSEMSQPEGLKTSQIETTLDEKNQAYVSPLVGRVLDGFVINETSETVTNDVFQSTAGIDKNYSIGNIRSGTSLSVGMSSDGIIPIGIDEKEELLLLSAIINSGACSAGYSLAYQTQSDTNAYKADSGKVRNADYSKIGNPESADNFNMARKDDAKSPNSNNLPYLITKYASGNSVFWTLCASTPSSVTADKFLSLRITSDLDMSVYKNGYRGIGGRYNCTATSKEAKTNSGNADTTGQFQRNTPVFVAIDGNNYTLKVDNQIYGYSDDNYVANAAGGLVNVLRRKTNTELTAQNLTVSGRVELHDFSDQPDSTADTNASGRNYAASVGGVIGRYFTEETTSNSITYLNLNNLKAANLTLYSDGAAGGIVGQTGVKTFFVFGSASNQYASGVTYTDCGYTGLTATSCQSTGGIVGAACDNANNYYYGSSNSQTITNGIVISSINTDNTGSNSRLSVYASKVSANGLGGLIGNAGSHVEINKDGPRPVVLDRITLQRSDSSGVSRTGGAIGFVHHGTTKAYNITVSNSTMGNKKEDNLGGIVGCWYSDASEGVLEDIIIDSCTLDADLSVGGVVGYIDQGAKIIRNITVKNTTIIQKSGSASRGKAMVVGQIRKGGISGENILLKDNQVQGNTTNNGRIVGYVDKTNGIINDLPIQFLGVSVQYGNTVDVSTQSNSDIGNISYEEYPSRTNKIFITYDAFLTEKRSGRELAQYPNVEIAGIGKITGDTALPYTITGSADVTGIVKKDGTSYKYIGSGKNYQNVDAANADKLVPGIVSTYNANQDNKIPADFDVVQIDGSAACLKQYLNAATNGAFGTGVAINSDSVMQVEIQRYQWNSDEGKFKEVTNTTKPTLTYDSTSGNFYATAQYDNQENMFTLVSVTFKTTANNYSRTYHVPVIVRRMLQVDFMATMVSGTMFNAAEMEHYNTHALASAGEKITGYLTFRYNSNLSGQPATYDWQNYMEAGANLLGYYKKTLDTGSTELPEGTHITLIDCQQSQRRYHAVVPKGKTSKLELFNGEKLTFTHSDGTAYQPVTMAELLKISVDQITEPEYTGVKWVRVDDEADATVMDRDGYYYRLYDPDKDQGIPTTNCFALQVTETAPKENYFVIISVPRAESHMLTLILSGGVTKGSFAWSNEGSSAPPTEVHQLHRYTNTNGQYTAVDTNASSEISFNFLDNYTQDLSDTISPPEVVPVTSEDSFVKMKFELQNKITFNPENYERSDPLYQEFRVSLQKTVDGVASDVYFPSDAKATVDLYAYYKNGDQKTYFTYDINEGKLIESQNGEQPVATYDWLAGNDGNMILPFAVLQDGTYHYIDLSPLRIAATAQKQFYIEVKLHDSVSIGISSVLNNDLLPTREEEDSQNQTKMQFMSVLSFKESGLSYSTLRTSATGKNGYYLNENREAILKLDYLSVDQLGINLSDEHSDEIDGILTLDFSGADGFNSNLSKFEILNDAEAVVFDFTLKQKSDSDSPGEKYQDAEIRSYLTDVSITGGENLPEFKLRLEKNGGSFPYYNEATGVFSIPITFKVNTENVEWYANYRICANAIIRKEGNPLTMAINTEKAFITYTIAKINTNGIWENPST